MIDILDQVAGALARRAPVVALETTIITHGLPYPANVDAARTLERAIGDDGAVAATIGVIRGRVLSDEGEAERMRIGASIMRLKDVWLPRRWGWPRRLSSVAAVAGIAVGLGLLPMPYEYYTLLRIFLCGVSLYYLSQTAVSDNEKWVLVGLAVLHNPIIPIELGDGILWAFANIGTAAFFGMVNRRRTRAPRW